MDYVVASTSVTDEIHLADGRLKGRFAGGAGIYALCGIKLWCDDVLLVTGVGADYFAMYGEWFYRNHLSMEGLRISDDRTPCTIVQYLNDGERVETPLLGQCHYQRMEMAPEVLKPYFLSARGIYIFRDCDKNYWQKIITYKKFSRTKVLWEIRSDAARRPKYSCVKEIAGHMDIFSINIAEARCLTGQHDICDIIAIFQTWDVPLIYLRRGSEGAVLITSDQVRSHPPAVHVTVMDTTGAGNSSSAAVLYGFSEGLSLAECAEMGNLAAVMCMAQFGVPDNIGIWRSKFQN